MTREAIIAAIVGLAVFTGMAHGEMKQSRKQAHRSVAVKHTHIKPVTPLTNTFRTP